MKRSGFKSAGKLLSCSKGFKPRETTLARSSTLKTTKAMPRSTKALSRATAPMRARSKRNSDPRPKTGEAELCRGQPCYLLVPGVPRHDPATVVPCHSNQIRHGKGKGIKAHDEFTVPGCMLCHAEIDQGNRFTRAEKFAIWDAAYARWEQRRIELQSSK